MFAKWRYVPTVQLRYYPSISIPLLFGWLIIKAAKHKLFSERYCGRGKTIGRIHFTLIIPKTTNPRRS